MASPLSIYKPLPPEIQEKIEILLELSREIADNTDAEGTEIIDTPNEVPPSTVYEPLPPEIQEQIETLLSQARNIAENANKDTTKTVKVPGLSKTTKQWQIVQSV